MVFNMNLDEIAGEKIIVLIEKIKESPRKKLRPILIQIKEFENEYYKLTGRHYAYGFYFEGNNIRNRVE